MIVRLWVCVGIGEGIDDGEIDEGVDKGVGMV